MEDSYHYKLIMKLLENTGKQLRRLIIISDCYLALGLAMAYYECDRISYDEIMSVKKKIKEIATQIGYKMNIDKEEKE